MVVCAWLLLVLLYSALKQWLNEMILLLPCVVTFSSFSESNVVVERRNCFTCLKVSCMNMIEFFQIISFPREWICQWLLLSFSHCCRVL